MNFSDYLSRYKWKPIRNCPGRYCLDRSENMRFNRYYNRLSGIGEFNTEKTADAVLVYSFSDGGLISFRHTDGYIVHTLNTSEGFKRKLDQLRISGSGESP